MNRGARAWFVLVTSEHGGNDVPPAYRDLFAGREALLDSHRGWDPGTLSLARQLARSLTAPLVAATVTRLLVDLNRSTHNPSVFSQITRVLPRPERLALLERFHRPHWSRVRNALQEGIRESGRALHLAVHSFTPLLDGRARRPDLALLYDPARAAERELVAAWVGALADAAPDRAIGRNDPYRGNADGLTTAMRTEYPGSQYLGIEVEVNQRHLATGGTFPRWVAEALLSSLAEVLGPRVASSSPR